MEVNGSEGVDEGRHTRAAEVETVDLVRKKQRQIFMEKKGKWKVFRRGGGPKSTAKTG